MIIVNDQYAIGLIDSGVGGLTVVKELCRQLPNENFIYLGDTAHCPYGSKPTEQVIQYTWQMTNFLLRKKIKLLVIACNTATAAVLEEIKNTLDIPVIGVIAPGARAAIAATKSRRIGVIGTEGTIKSQAYEKNIKLLVEKSFVSCLACPSFVPLVEMGNYHTIKAKEIVTKTLAPLKLKQLDTLVLGCTHYPLLRSFIQTAIGSQVTLIDPSIETVKEIQDLLAHSNKLTSNQTNNNPSRKFYTTGSIKTFEKIAIDWLEQEIDVEYVRLGETAND